MTPQVSKCIPGSLEDTDKYIQVADENYVTEKQEGQAQIKMCEDNGNPFITIFHNVLLAPNLCNLLFWLLS